MLIFLLRKSLVRYDGVNYFLFLHNMWGEYWNINLMAWYDGVYIVRYDTQKEKRVAYQRNTHFIYIYYRWMNSKDI